MNCTIRSLLIWIVAPFCAVSVNFSCAQNLFDEKQFQSIVSDQRAFKKGDLVTLFIIESAKANASEDKNKAGSVNIKGGFGLSKADVSPPDRSGRSESVTGEVEMGADKTFSNQRSGSVRAQITVSVLEVKDRDQLFVAGEQKININGNEQYIRASGWLRIQDIDKNNSALSSRLSDAQIEYVGNKNSDKGFIRRVWGYVKKIW